MVEGAASLEPLNLHAVHCVLQYQFICAAISVLQDALHWLRGRRGAKERGGKEGGKEGGMEGRRAT